jgi:hypothetical protein
MRIQQLVNVFLIDKSGSPGNLNQGGYDLGQFGFGRGREADLGCGNHRSVITNPQELAQMWPITPDHANFSQKLKSRA